MSWHPVTEARPCEACGRTDWCERSENGELLHCQCAAGAPAGWVATKSKPATVFRLAAAPIPGTPHIEETVKPKMSSAEVASLAARCSKALTHDRLVELAEVLGVRPESVLSIGAGWLEQDSAWTFPEVDATGAMIGLGRRFADPSFGKKAINNTRRGLVVPSHFKELSGVVLVVEGASDVAAAVDVGMAAVGRPSNRAGGAMLAELLRARADHVVVLGERDQKEDGKWPGQEGMLAIAQHLADAWGRPVRTWMPPQGAKDFREFVADQRVDGKADAAIVRFVVDAIARDGQDIGTNHSDAGDEFEAQTLATIGASGATEAEVPRTPRALTDLGNAERLVDRYGDRIAWSAGIKWLVWSENRWVVDDVGRVLDFAGQSARAILREAESIEDHDRRKAVATHAIRSEHRSRIEAAMALAIPRVAVQTSKLDANGLILNVRNGLVCLRTGALMPHDRGQFCTKVAPVDYDPAAECPRFIAFLRRIFDGDEGLVGYTRNMLGQSLVADAAKAQRLWVWVGAGANGKSTLSSVLLRVLGDYATIAAPGLLMERREEHSAMLADLRGRRLVIAAETDDGGRLDMARVKMLTGEESIKAHFMRADWIEFPRTFSLVAHTNHRPIIADTSEAAWRRVVEVPFSVTIPEAERDATLADKLSAEAPGILRWLVAGAVQWCRTRSLVEPDAVKAATASYRAESDTLGQWIDTATESGLGFSSNKRLRGSYQAWCQAEGYQPIGGKRFGDSLRVKGFKPGKDRGERGWFGIRLVDGSDRLDAN